VTPRLRLTVAAMVPVVEQPAFDPGEPQAAQPLSLSFARLPAAGQAATAVVKRIVVLPALGAQAVVRARPALCQQMAARAFSIPVRPD